LPLSASQNFVNMAPTYRKLAPKRSRGFSRIDRLYRQRVPNGLVASGDSLQFFATRASDARYAARVRRVARSLFGRPSRVGFTAGNLFKDFWDPKKHKATLKHKLYNRQGFVSRAHRNVATGFMGQTAPLGAMMAKGLELRSLYGPAYAQSWANRVMTTGAGTGIPLPPPRVVRPPPSSVVVEAADPVADPLYVRRVTDNAIVPVGVPGVTPYSEPVVVGFTPAGERVFNVRPSIPTLPTDRYQFTIQRAIRRRVA